MINNDCNNMICENGKFHIAFGIDQTHSASLTLPGRYAKIFAEMADSQDEYNNQNAFQFFGMEYFKLSDRDREKFQAIIDIGFVDSLLNRIIDLAILVQKLEWFECIKNADNFRNLGRQLTHSDKHVEETAAKFHNKVRGIFHSDGSYYYITGIRK